MNKHHLKKLLVDVVQPVSSVVFVHQTIEEAIAYLRLKHVEHKIVYVYVIDENQKLLGVVSTRKLLLEEPHVLILNIMETDITHLFADQTLEEAMETFARSSLLALPVVDKEEKLLGVIDVEMYIEESFDIANARHRSDIFQIIGLSLEDEVKSSAWGDYRLRMPWILCNMMGGIVCAIISHFHEVVLSKALLLAMFIPLVLTLSESISMQSMTHSLQFLRRPRISWKGSFFRLMREWQTVALMALSSGVFVGIISLLWKDGMIPSATIGFGIMLSIFISASCGILFPIILHKTKLDPKVASGPVVLMLADVLTTGIYLTLANWWIL